MYVPGMYRYVLVCAGTMDQRGDSIIALTDPDERYSTLFKISLVCVTIDALKQESH